MPSVHEQRCDGGDEEVAGAAGVAEPA